MAESKNVGPVEAFAVTQSGSTFAERKAAADKRAATKNIDAESVEDKAVTKKSTSVKKG